MYGCPEQIDRCRQYRFGPADYRSRDRAENRRADRPTGVARTWRATVCRGRPDVHFGRQLETAHGGLATAHQFGRRFARHDRMVATTPISRLITLTTPAAA